MLNSGLGETQVNHLLAALNIPRISPTTLKRREREVGNSIQELAQQSCSEALIQEAQQ
jgi:hypothetical protein